MNHILAYRILRRLNVSTSDSMRRVHDLMMGFIVLDNNRVHISASESFSGISVLSIRNSISVIDVASTIRHFPDAETCHIARSDVLFGPILHEKLADLTLDKCRVDWSPDVLSADFGPKSLTMEYCDLPEQLMDIGVALISLDLSGSTSLRRLGKLPSTLEKLYLSGTSVRELPDLPASLRVLSTPNIHDGPPSSDWSKTAFPGEYFRAIQRNFGS